MIAAASAIPQRIASGFIGELIRLVAPDVPAGAGRAGEQFAARAGVELFEIVVQLGRLAAVLAHRRGDQVADRAGEDARLADRTDEVELGGRAEDVAGAKVHFSPVRDCFAHAPALLKVKP